MEEDVEVKPRNKKTVNIRRAHRLDQLPITPSCRWRCQVLLQRSLGVEELASVFCTDAVVVYVRAVEEAAYRLTSNPTEYRNKLRQLIYNLNLSVDGHGGGRHLMDTYEPDVLVTLSDDQLAEHTSRRRQRLDYENRMVECRKLLGATNIFEGLQSSVVLAKCRHCGNTDLDYDFKQVRSADEGMNTFVTCKRCNKRWTQRG